MSEFRTLRGMRDFLPDETGLLRSIEGKAREVARLYGYREVITPVLESYELLAAKAGEEVRTRMYAFKDLGGRMVALRPEFTASIARLVAVTLRNEPKPIRLYCIGSLYRYDEPQKGRFREFWQSNFELIGSDKAEADSEILLLTNRFMKAVGLKGYVFKVSHIGILRSIFGREGVAEDAQNRALQLMDKKMYNEALSLLRDAGASEKCLKTVKEIVEIKGSNVNSILAEIEKLIQDYEEAVYALKNLARILKLVEAHALNVTVDAGFARGLEYYTGMIFEVYVPELNIALAGGGRYDRLVELFGGEPTPAVGVAHGLDRIMLAVQEQNAPLETRKANAAALIATNETLAPEGIRIAEMLRSEGVPVEMEVMGRRVTKALEDADRRGAPYVVLVGEKELTENSVVLRDMHKKQQQVVKIEDLAKILKDLGI
ncbi:MAG: histidine--tRNA ligase [Candidatus Bathyarchaeota archaeon]|nr:histidine--tRNA ligase [Candidatus Bathyarchaeota archaeon]